MRINWNNLKGKDKKLKKKKKEGGKKSTPRSAFDFLTFSLVSWQCDAQLDSWSVLFHEKVMSSLRAGAAPSMPKSTKPKLSTYFMFFLVPCLYFHRI